MIVVIQGLVVLFAGALEHLSARPVAVPLARRNHLPRRSDGRSAMDLFKCVHRRLRLPAIRLGTPLILACLAGLWSERSGVVDIGLEGKIRVRAFVARRRWPTFTGSVWLGLLGGVAATIAVSLIHGYASIDQRANQIVSGTAINMVADGMTALIGNAIWSRGRTDAGIAGLRPSSRRSNLPFALAFGAVPIVGPDLTQRLISGHDLITYVAFLLVLLTYRALYAAPGWTAPRAVGENPAAVDTAGISVRALRYGAVMICGVLVGLAGVYLVLSQEAYFQPHMSAGRGFIALAALVFAKWRPWPALATCLLFGFLDAVAIRMQGAVLPLIGPVPVQAIEALPYILTVVLLAGFIGKAIPPKASGISLCQRALTRRCKNCSPPRRPRR